ncbi:MAG TPA: hypothetical protein PLB59_03885 [Bacteroidales bacterium]|nr:hypothetical protein [Bacteroidales bacterium]HPI30671.1 hypothetical protein [Bacteroidales bacterium]HQN15573.1 hypothetical protein [Bacteroidales bacterium]HQP15086.1 hypothetical protein [Bacteroidales bacterium]
MLPPALIRSGKSCKGVPEMALNGQEHVACFWGGNNVPVHLGLAPAISDKQPF